MPLIIPSNSISGEFEVANSLRFNDGSSDDLRRTPSSTSNRKTWTFSTWVKRSALTNDKVSLFGSNNANTDAGYMQFRFQEGETLNLTGYTVDYRTTNRVFRDLSAWYHIVLALDTTQGTASNRLKLYINGLEETSFSTSNNPTLNQDTPINVASSVNYIGSESYSSGTSRFFDGYMAETVLIDGSQLEPTSFGEFDEDTGIWKPIDVSGLTFGTNGFYLDFENSGSLGADVSGNGNNFTVNNLTSIDQTTDTPTNNYCTMNPLVFNTSTGNTFAEGNLQVSTTDSAVFGAVSSIGVSSGKWYMEVKPTQIENKNALGITSSASDDARNNTRPGTSTNSVGIRSSGDVQSGGSSVSGSWDSFTTSDIVGIALDLDNNNLYFSKNGTFMNSADPTSGATGTGAISLTDPASTTDGFYFFAFGDPGAGAGTSNIAQFNFGSPPYTISSGNSDGNGYGNFEYAVPSGYYALNTKNLSEFG